MNWLKSIRQWLAIHTEWVEEFDNRSAILATMETTTTPVNPDVLLPWGNAADNRHNVRVLCDLAGMAFSDKNILCAVVGGESGWLNYLPDGNPVKHENLGVNGSLLSTDWGICQINDYWHIGQGKDFPTAEYVMANPEAVVNWMITMYKEGNIKDWDAYLSGNYKKYL